MASFPVLVSLEDASHSFGRSGLYPAPFFPMPMAWEVSGVLLELPRDEAILNSPEYKNHGFKKGGVVVLARVREVE